MTRPRKSMLAAAALGALATASAPIGAVFADTTDASNDIRAELRPADPSQAGERMVLPMQRVLVQGFVEVNLSSDAALKPVSIAPDAWYGLDDALTLGLIHSTSGTTGFFGGVGSGLCITGSSNGCDSVYDNVGLAARYHLLSKPVVLAADAGVFVRDFDPFQLAVKAGVVGKWQVAKVSLLFQPNLFIGITERDSGNKELLNIPVAGMLSLTPTLGLGLQTGVVLPLSGTGDLWQLPVSIGARYMATGMLSVDGVFSLPLIAGGDAYANTGFDARVLTLGVSVVL